MDPSKLFAGGGPTPGGGPGGAPAMAQISPEELAALGGMEGLRAKMSHLWSHLDQLAERSPEEYGQFLDKQARDAGVDAAAFQQFQRAAAGKGPAPGEGPGLVVLTRDEAGGGEVGICVWPRAEEEEAGGAGGGAGPGPATVRGASLADLEAAGPAGRDYAGLVVPFHFGRAARSRAASPWLRGFAAPGAAVVDVECHGPSLAAVLAGGKELRMLFVELAFQSVEVEKGLRLSRRNRRLRTARPPPPRDVSQLASGTNLAARGVSDSLLGTLASLSSPETGGGAAAGKGAGPRAAAKPKDEPAKKKKVLIEEIAPESAFRYTVKRAEGPAGGAGAWEVLVEVPGVDSVKHLVVEAAEAAVIISRRGGGPGTEIALGAAIDPGSVRAKLDKKKHRLRIAVAAKAE